MRREANAVTLHADNTEGFTSPASEELHRRRAEDDPFKDDYSIDEAEAYATGSLDVPEATLDDLIALLAVECITTHLQRGTPLVRRLAGELGRERPPAVATGRRVAGWIPEGPIDEPDGRAARPGLRPATASGGRSRSWLTHSPTLFTDAAEGRLDDPKLAQRLNEWLPVNLRTEAGRIGTAKANGKRH